MTLRPFLVLMRVRKPWTSLRWRFLGWKVLFMVVSSVKTRPRWWGISGPKMGTGLQFNSISHSMAFCQAFFSLSCKLFCEKIFNFFTILPWKTLLPQDIVALFCPCHNGRAGAFLMYYKLHYRNMDAQRFLWYTNLVSAALLKTLTEWMFYGFF